MQQGLLEGSLGYRALASTGITRALRHRAARALCFDAYQGSEPLKRRTKRQPGLKAPAMPCKGLGVMPMTMPMTQGPYSAATAFLPSKLPAAACQVTRPKVLREQPVSSGSSLCPQEAACVLRKQPASSGSSLCTQGAHVHSA